MLSSRGKRAAGRWPFVVLFLLLGGLFAMHGLADHGNAHSRHASSQAEMAEMPGMDMAGDLTAMVAGALVAPVAGPGGDHPGHPDGAVCLALLQGLVAGLVLLLARAGRRRLPAHDASRRPLGRTWSPVRARAPDPPDLTRLGLCRC